MDHFSKWTLKSLTIGPQFRHTNTQFWEAAFDNLPSLPSVDNVTIIYNYDTADVFNTDCWVYFDHVLTRKDMFPALRSVHVQPSIIPPAATPLKWWAIYDALRTVRMEGLNVVTSKSLIFERGHGADPLTTRSCLVTDWLPMIDDAG